VLHSSATGKVLARARVPLGLGVEPTISGTADGRTYLVEDNNRRSAGNGYDVRFYRLRVGPDGRSLRVDRLPIRTSPVTVTDAALSPDGGTLAIAEAVPCKGKGKGPNCLTGQIQVRSTTGATRTWRSQTEGGPAALSLSSGGRQIVFQWTSFAGQARNPRPGYRLLNAAGPGGDLLAASRAIPANYFPGTDDQLIPAQITPDGQALITSSTRIVHGRGRHLTVTTEISQLSAATGQVQRVLYTRSVSGIEKSPGPILDLENQGCWVLALDAAGEHPLTVCALLGKYTFGVLDGSSIRPLPGIPGDCAHVCTAVMLGLITW
jgi:hypothetical protein